MPRPLSALDLAFQSSPRPPGWVRPPVKRRPPRKRKPPLRRGGRPSCPASPASVASIIALAAAAGITLPRLALLLGISWPSLSRKLSGHANLFPCDVYAYRLRVYKAFHTRGIRINLTT